VNSTNPPQGDIILKEGLYRAQRVLDPFTLVVVPEEFSASTPRPRPLRLLGIAQPEGSGTDQHDARYTAAARRLTESLVAGKSVRLRFDRRRADDDGCPLAYVYQDDHLVNEELVRAGLARVATMPGDSEPIARRLRTAEREAREQQCGIWSRRSELQ
jgi:endonuclease YncB( thermonuclease family)